MNASYVLRFNKHGHQILSTLTSPANCSSMPRDAAQSPDETFSSLLGLMTDNDFQETAFRLFYVKKARFYCNDALSDDIMNRCGLRNNC